ncbi:MAG: molybdopterin molybdotransferase MoeA [Actinomycetes bacterium]
MPEDPEVAEDAEVAEDTAWPEAQRAATAQGLRHQASVRQPLDVALGGVLTASLKSLVDLPPFDTSAMDGWAVRGAGPWLLVGDTRAGELPTPLLDGQCVAISTGAVAPPGSAIVRSETGRVEGGQLRVGDQAPSAGHDVRPRGEEVRAGEQILSVGQVLTPPAIGLAAAAGHDYVDVLRRPCVSVLVLGDELAHSGIPADGKLRDALAPQLPGWIEAMGATVVSVKHVADSQLATEAALRAADADLVITTGGTARGPADHVRNAFGALEGQWLVDGVAVRPGHPMKLGALPDQRSLVALPGNPLAAVSGLVTLAWPLIDAQSGRSGHEQVMRPLATAVDSSPAAYRLVPGRMVDGSVVLTTRRGPAMLSGIAIADVLAVIPPGHTGAAGSPVQVIALPWGSGLLV